MKVLKKRSLAIALALVMALALLPSLALAADGDLKKVEFQETEESFTGLVFVFEGKLDTFNVSDVTEFSIVMEALMEGAPGVTLDIEIDDSAENVSVADSNETRFFVAFLDEGVLDTLDTYTGTGKYKGVEFTVEGTISADDPVITDPSTPSTPSTPEEPADWAKVHVDELKAKNIVPAELLSAYTSNIRRDEFTALMWNVYVFINGDDVTVENENKFNDIADNKYKEQILKANMAEIVAGRGEAFDPSNTLIREEMSAFVNNLFLVAQELKLPDAEKTNFADNADISAWAIPHVAYSAANELLAGKDNNMFVPKGILTRQEAMAAANNVLRKIAALETEEEEAEPGELTEK